MDEFIFDGNNLEDIITTSIPEDIRNSFGFSVHTKAELKEIIDNILKEDIDD